MVSEHQKEKDFSLKSVQKAASGAGRKVVLALPNFNGELS